MKPNEFAPSDKHRATLALARKNFEIFVLLAFRVLSDEPYQHNWHIAAIAHCPSSEHLAQSGARISGALASSGV